MNCEEARNFVDSWEEGTIYEREPTLREFAASATATGTTTASMKDAGYLDTVRFSAFRLHLSGCPDCTSGYGALLPLILRDVQGCGVSRNEGGLAEGTECKAPLPEGFAAKVMERIGDTATAIPVSAGTRPSIPGPGGIVTFRTTAATRRREGQAGRMNGRFMPVLAMAAAAIFVMGIGVGLWFRKPATTQPLAQAGETVTVRFVLEARDAHSVQLVGDFDDWSGSGYAMEAASTQGLWEVNIPLEKGRMYVYNFVLDGEHWITDSSVPTIVEDGFGGQGSLLRL